MPAPHKPSTPHLAELKKMVKTSSIATTPENLIPGTIHWSSKVQVKGTEGEMTRLGATTHGRGRNRERRPIYILRKMALDTLLVM
jgi:RNA-splicing ligase RtcB